MPLSGQKASTVTTSRTTEHRRQLNIEFSCRPRISPVCTSSANCISSQQAAPRRTTATTRYDHNPRDGMHGSCIAQCTCNKSDYCYALSLFNSEPRHIFMERRSGFNGRGAIKSASLQFRRTSPCHPIEVHTVKHLLLPKRLILNSMAWRYTAKKQIQRKSCERA